MRLRGKLPEVMTLELSLRMSRMSQREGEEAPARQGQGGGQGGGPSMPVGLRDLAQGCHCSLPGSLVCKAGQPLLLPGGCWEDPVK